MNYQNNLKTLNNSNISDEWESFFNPLKGIYYSFKESDWNDTVQRIFEDFYTYLIMDYDLNDMNFQIFSKFVTNKAKWIELDKKMWKINTKLKELEKDFE